MKTRVLASVSLGIVLVALIFTGGASSSADVAATPVNVAYEEEIAALQNSARKGFAGTFAGLWADETSVHVAFTESAEKSLSSLAEDFPAPDLLVAETRDATEQELTRTQQRMVADRESVRDGSLQISTVGDARYDLLVDLPANEVRATFADAPTGAQSEFQARYGDQVRVKEGPLVEPVDCTRNDCRYNMKAGLRIMSDLAPDNTYGICTSGFVVQGPGGNENVLSAAHCSRTERRHGPISGTIGQRFGDVVDQKQSGSVDSERISIASSWEGRGSIYLSGSTPGRLVDGRTSYSDMFVGKSVCKSGQTTGYNCGHITCLDASPSYVTNGNNFLCARRQGGTGQELCAGSGDSGSPVFSGDPAIAHGILSGSTTNGCWESDWYLLFGHIEYALGQLDATLVQGT